MREMLKCLVLCCLLVIGTVKGCAVLNYCNGHGRCASNGTDCICDIGWGSWFELTNYRAPDCSARSCPSGPAWSDLPLTNTTAHQPAECSNAGLCNRLTGQCVCNAGFEGKACNRYKCPNDCSGHGRCKSMRRLALSSDAQPLGPNVDYGYFMNDTAWDADMIYGCICDSSWPVGYDADQTNVAEWFGPDCSRKHCPSNWDRKFQTSNVTDCFNVTLPDSGSATVGLPGSLCFQECSGQGTCDYSTGTCKCFKDRWGADCAYYNGYVPPVQNITIEVEVDDTVEYYTNLAASIAAAKARARAAGMWVDP